MGFKGDNNIPMVRLFLYDKQLYNVLFIKFICHSGYIPE